MATPQDDAGPGPRGEEGAPPTLPRVGNDVVDLGHPLCRDRRPGDRLLDRILSRDEESWLEGAPDGDAWLRRLWALWAAKETAFKVASKLPGAPGHLRYRAFECELKEIGESGGAVLHLRGRVRWPGSQREVRVEGSSDGSYVHLVGWSGRGEETPRMEAGLEGGGGAPENLEAYRPLFSDEEWEGIYSVPAAEARLRARDRLAAHLGLLEEEGAGSEAPHPPGDPSPCPVQIVTSGTRPGRTAPRIRIRGRERPDLDVSLSHHGRYVAWAFLVPEGRPSPLARTAAHP